jgi:competence protein ComEA
VTLGTQKLAGAIMFVLASAALYLRPVQAGRHVTQSATVQDSELPDGPGKSDLLTGCTACHTTERIVALRGRFTKKQWTLTVDQMVQRGVDTTSVDVDLILEYLIRNFAKNEKVNVNRADRGELISALSLSEKEADTFLDYRKQHGDFKTFDELLAIDGVDRKKLEAAKDLVDFN